MKQEVKDQNRLIRDRVKVLKAEELDIKKQNEQINIQAQQLQQHFNNNTAKILKLQGAIEELEKTVK